MKFWEALKAVDEGKTVQCKNTEAATPVWLDWSKDQILNCRPINCADYFELRIKPEPRVFNLWARGTQVIQTAHNEEWMKGNGWERIIVMEKLDV